MVCIVSTNVMTTYLLKILTHVYCLSIFVGSMLCNALRYTVRIRGTYQRSVASLTALGDTI